MQHIVQRAMICFVFCSVIVFCSGCVPAVGHDIYVSKLSSLDGTLEEMPAIPGGYSRVVVYYPRLSVTGVLISGAGATPVTLENDDFGYKIAGIMDQTAEYFDVPSGVYTLRDDVSKKETRFTAEPSQTHYFRIENDTTVGFLDSTPPTLVDGAQAIVEIRDKKIKAVRYESVRTAVPKKKYSIKEYSSAPEIAPEKGHVKLYVIRDTGFIGSFVPIQIGLNCLPGFPLKSDRYCCISAPPGRYILSHCMRSGSKDTFLIGRFLELKKSETYLLFKREPLTGVFLIEELTSDEAKRCLAKSKLNQNGYLVYGKE